MGVFIKNYARTITTEAVVLVIALLTSVVLARLLGPAGRGIYSLCIFLPSVIINFTSLGITAATSYYTARKDFPIKEILGNTVIMTLAISFISIVLGLVIIRLFINSFLTGAPRLLLIISLLIIPINMFIFNINNIFLGLRRIKDYNVFRFLAALSALIFITYFVFALKMGIAGGIAGNILSIFLISIFMIFWAIRLTGGISFRPNLIYIKNAVIFGIKNHAGNVLSFLNFRVDIFIVNAFLNPLFVGLYISAVVIAEQLGLISYTVSLLIFPHIAGEKDEARRKEFTPFICRNILLLSVLGGLVMYLISPVLVTFFYSSSFSLSAQPLRILLIGIAALSVWRILASDLAGRGKPVYNIYINLLAVSINIILNIIWIPRFGICGAAWASVFSYTIAAISALLIYSKVTSNHLAKMLLPQYGDLNFYLSFIRGSWKKAI